MKPENSLKSLEKPITEPKNVSTGSQEESRIVNHFDESQREMNIEMNKGLDSLKQDRLRAIRNVEGRLAEENKNCPAEDWKGDIEPHPLNFFPKMRMKEYDALVEDIRVNGIQEPITLYEGKILDGRARYQACLETGRELKFQRPGDISPISYLIAKNVNRRHLNASQKAVLALQYLPYFEVEAQQRMKAGIEYHEISAYELDLDISEEALPKDLRAKFPQGGKGRARDFLGLLIGISGRYITDARKIQSKAPELLNDVWEGYINIPAAKRLLKIPEKERSTIIHNFKFSGLDKNINKAITNAQVYRNISTVAVAAYNELKNWNRKYKAYENTHIFEIFDSIFQEIKNLKWHNLRWHIQRGDDPFDKKKVIDRKKKKSLVRKND